MRMQVNRFVTQYMHTRVHVMRRVYTRYYTVIMTL